MTKISKIKVQGVTHEIKDNDAYVKPASGIPASDIAEGVIPDISGKQDVITDLDTIRSGAAAGATAYQKPSTGIPANALSSAVQTSLGKADTALQSYTETDPTVPSWAKAASKPSYSYSEISGKPTLGTAAAKDVAASGNASTTQIVMGNDTRLSDARPASDVSSWAKASSKPSYTKSEVGLGNVTNDAQVKRTEMGAASGVATLGTDGKVPSSQLPSYVDDVLEYNSSSSFPSTGESGKIYVAKDTNKTYRWSGTGYVEISPSIVIGTTTGTAYDGGSGAALANKLSGIEAGAQVHRAPTAVEVKSALGTGSGTTKYLREDGSWATPPNDDTNTHRPVQVNGTEILGNNTTALNLKAGSNVSLSNSGGTVTITATDTNTWRPISDSVSSTDSSTSASSKAVKTAYDLAASKTSNTGTVTSVATGVGLTGGSITTSGTVKAKLKDETANTADSSRSTSTSGGLYSVEVDKSGNLAVRVPWTDHTYTVNNGSFTIKGAGTSVSSTSANASGNTSVDIVAGSNVTVTPDATNGKITISSTDTNTWRPLGTTADTACAGNDSRLSDSRPASDVYSWAKASSKPSYTASEVGLGNVGNFKAVSTVASQGLSSTEQANARANIGAGTSSFSGSYNDLSNKPTIPTVNNATLTIQKNGSTVNTFTANASSNVTANITVPTKVSELTNDAGYTSNTGTITGITMNGSSKGTSGVVNLGTVLTQHQDISGKENTSNKVTSLSSSSTDTQYPSAKCVYDSIAPHANAVNTTWSALKSLRDNNQLIPGRQYRITDYITTTVQEDTQSAGHQFDIIVVADSTNKLNENARACLHAGDTYFSGAGAKLESWQLKYCLDNDTTRFVWAQQERANGITINGFASNYYYLESIVIDNTTYYVFCEPGSSSSSLKFGCLSQTPSVNDRAYAILNGSIVPYDLSVASVLPAVVPGTGVIYWMKDERNNECPYDFKNIQFKRYKVTATSKPNLNDLVDTYIATGKSMTNFTVDTSQSVWRYTFDTNGLTEDSIASDSSLNEFASIYDNVILDYYANNGIKLSLNGIVFYSHHCFGNSFGTNCYDNTFGGGCSYNTFGSCCSQNTFGNNCSYNTFGNNFSYGNTFGSGCSQNTFGNNCSYITFGNYCRSNTFGNGCTFIDVQKDNVYYIIVENGNQYINITSTQTTSSSNNLRNFIISQGVNNDRYMYKTISHNTLNDTFKTIYCNDSSGNTVSVNIADISGIESILETI